MISLISKHTSYKSLIKDLYQIKLNQTVKKITDRSKGFERKVFIVDTCKGSSVIKICATDDEASQYQLYREAWASRAWRDIDITVPELLISDHTRSLVGFEYIIQGRVDGIDMDELKLTKTNLRHVLRNLGFTLKKMHSIKTQGYGVLTSDLRGQFSNWTYLKEAITHLPRSIFRLGLFRKKQKLYIEKYFKERLELLDYSDTRLLHNDIHSGNVILSNDQIAGIIDFGDIMSGDPAFDLARAYQGMAQYRYIDDMLDAYGSFNRSRFEFYLLYHALWTAGFFSKNKMKKNARYSLDLVSRLMHREMWA